MPGGKRSTFLVLAAVIFLIAGAFILSLAQAKRPAPPAPQEPPIQMPHPEVASQSEPPTVRVADDASRVRELMKQLETAKAELTAARARLEVEREAQGGKLRDEIDALRRSTDELSAKLTASDAAQKEAEKAAEQAKNRRAALAQELKQANSATEQAVQQHEEAKKQTDQLTAELATAKAAAVEASKAHEAAVKDVQSKLAAANAKIQELTKEIAALKTEAEGSSETEQPEESVDAAP